MSRPAIATLAAVLVLAVGVFLLIRGGDGPSSPEERASNDALAGAMALGSLEAEAELDRRSQKLQEEQEKNGTTTDLDRFDDKVDRIDDLGWRAFNEQFRKTPFDKAIDKLPLRRPPLDVEQWVTDSPPNKLPNKATRERFYRMPERARRMAVRKFYRSAPTKLYARVDQDRWYRMSKRARAAAVRAFYRDAEKIVKKKGIRDFVLVVTPLTKTTEHLPAFAVGRHGTATLTPLGLDRPDNGV
jgi:hypothetical protein